MKKRQRGYESKDDDSYINNLKEIARGGQLILVKQPTGHNMYARHRLPPEMPLGITCQDPNNDCSNDATIILWFFSWGKWICICHKCLNESK